MAEDDQGFRWPADMECRREADLVKYYENNPDCNKVTNQKGLSSVRPLLPSMIKRGLGGPESNRLNRWSLETTLELLEAMKAYVRANKLSLIGVKHWTSIAINLSNPHNLELKKLARSSMVRFANIRRVLRRGKHARVEFEIRESLAEYYEICELHQQVASSKKSSMCRKNPLSKQSSPR